MIETTTLNYDELAARARDEGGFTVALDGHSPSTGYVVALEGHERILRPRTTRDIADAIYSYVVANGAELRHGLYLGAWLQGDLLYLDISEVVNDDEIANQLAADRNQLAYFDLTRGLDIATRAPVKR